MSEADTVENRSKSYAKQTVVAGFVVSIATLVIFYTSAFRTLRVPMAYALPIVLIYAIVLAFSLYRQGAANLPRASFLAGALFAAGGAALDGFATLANTPTLAREANRIARALLDSGHPLNFVIMYGVIAQGLFVLLLCILWAAFLRHRQILIASARSKNPKSVMAFVKAGLGAAHLSWRQYFFPLKPSDLPTAYHMVWAMTAVLVGGSLYRWYLGLAWLGAFPWSWSIAVLVIVFLLVSLVYMAWLALAYTKDSAAKAEG